jgi:hypothetical protein
MKPQITHLKTLKKYFPLPARGLFYPSYSPTLVLQNIIAYFEKIFISRTSGTNNIQYFVQKHLFVTSEDCENEQFWDTKKQGVTCSS